ncbi:aspartate aminotransferase family protein [Oscillospiraceae bacterium MB08-C2-2]|nr:aspartate aminotransferase family protein [Oscillospiraceae bacterium MB08-C2-2]
MLMEELPRIITETVPGPKASAIIERRAKATPAALRCLYPCVINRGEGAMVEDVDGNYFLDWIGGVGVLNLGYSRPEVVKAVQEQAERYFHCMLNIVTHEGYIELAEKINSIAPVRGEKKQTFFVNSGAEAVENAVKVAKAYTKRPNIIVFTGAFHGRTTLAMAMTAKKAYAKDMGSLPGGVFRAPYPYLYRKPTGMTDQQAIDYCIEKLRDVFEEATPADQVAAIVFEPVQGEGGFIPAPLEWVREVRKICDEYGILMVADEVQNGFCRTGRMFASCEWAEGGFAPDIITMAKSIAAGLPLGAVCARAEIMDGVPAGVIGGTYGGNPLACAASLKTIEIMEKEDYAGKARAIGDKLKSVYEGLKAQYPVIGDVRGLGAMVGVEIVKDPITKEPYPELVNRLMAYCAQHGLLIENAGRYGNVLRFLAPLIITPKQLDAGLAIVENALQECQ